MKYQAYADYKDSGVEWLGKIPSHWQYIRLKHVADLEGKKIEQDSTLKYVGMENIASGNGKYIAKDDTNPEGLSTSFLKGDVLFGKLRPYLAKSWLADFSGICSSEFLVLRNKQVCPQFLNYYTLTDEFINQVDSSTYGSKMPRASWDFISLMDVPVPLDNESENIANFLGHETAKIDTLIEKQQQLIKLLKEKRQAVISHAVTKGLNANAPMRDSGVEWLGEVPEHWEIPKIGHCAFVTKLTGFEYTTLWRTSEDGEIIALRGFNVKDGKLDLYKAERISVDLSKKLARSKLSKGDIVFPCTGTIGNAALIENDDKFHINQNIAKISFEGKVSPKFAVYWLTSSFVRTLIDRNNMSGMQPVVLIGDIRKLPIPGMSLEEQDLITGYLDIQISKFNKIIGSGEQAIELMQERRTALISAAVTGKIDVRNWQAPEPSHGNIETHKEAAA